MISTNTEKNAAPRLRDHLWKLIRETTFSSQASKKWQQQNQESKCHCSITTDSCWYPFYRIGVKSQADASTAGRRGRVGGAEQKRSTGPTLSSFKIWFHPCHQIMLMLNQIGGRASKLHQCLENANRQQTLDPFGLPRKIPTKSTHILSNALFGWMSGKRELIKIKDALLLTTHKAVGADGKNASPL